MNTPKKKSVFDMLGGHSQGAAAPEIARKIPLSDIRPDPNQPRKHIDQADLEDMAESMREVGVITPITVKPSGTIPPWDLVAGERRWRSAALAGLAEIPAYIRDDLSQSDARIPLMQLIENANRKDLTDLETAHSIKKLLDQEAEQTGKSYGGKSRVARLINRSPQVVSRYLAMLEPPASEWCEAGLVTSADVVQFLRSAPDSVRDQLLHDARESGNVITQAQVREATKEHAAAAVPPSSSTVASSDTAAPGTGSSSAVSPVGDHNAAAAPAAADSESTHEGAGDVIARGASETHDDVEHSTGHAPDSDESSETTAGDRAGEIEGNSPAHNDGLVDDEHDEHEDDDNSFAHSSNNSGDNGGRASDRSSGGAREKAVTISLTGEKVEDLLRFLVDKSSDRLEVRLSADLGRAVIENLGGEVPERSDTYGSLIADLLASR